VLGALDLHLFNEGTHQRLWHMLGAHVQPEGGVRFSVWAPGAHGVAVVGDFDDWQPHRHRMSAQGSSGVWVAHVSEAGAGQRYKFVIDGADGRQRWKADPMARRTELPPSDASIVEPASRFTWSDESWLAERDARRAGERPLRIYEVHLGSWRAASTGRAFVELAEPLAQHVRALGFTHVELMPVAEHPYGGSWGYQVTGYFAPSARYGTPDDLRHFVDVMHAHGVGVIVDWVPAHFPKDDWALARFDGTALYEHVDPRRGEHPDWGTYVFNYGRHEVRSFLVSSAHVWFDEFHVDGLRVDAVASMLYLDYSRGEGAWLPNQHGGRENLDAVSLLQTVNATVLTAHAGAVMAAEESTAWPGVTLPPEAGGLGFTHKWNMGWMNDTLSYFSREPIHRRWHHHELTFGLLYGFSETFVLPLSHDEVVHGKGSLLAKMPGDDWQRFANLRALYGWMWAHPGDTLVFMGAELAPWTEWSESSPLPWHLLEHEPHAGVHRLVERLGQLSQQWSALSAREHDPAGFVWLDADDTEHSLYALLRWGVHGADAVACVANLTPVPRHGYRLGVPWAGAWEVLLDTDDPQWGGSGHRSVAAGTEVWRHEAGGEPWQGQAASLMVDLAPLSVLWLGARRS
jgi:1,4-alpha-glucan branching enzyme